MIYLFLQRRLVWVLYEKFNLERKYPARKEFVKYFVEKERGFLFRKDTEEKYNERIDRILGSCIAPRVGVSTRQEREKYFIDYAEDRADKMYITDGGIYFLSIGGFIEIAVSKFNKMLLIVGYIVSMIISFIIGSYRDTIWNIIKTFLM